MVLLLLLFGVTVDDFFDLGKLLVRHGETDAKPQETKQSQLLMSQLGPSLPVAKVDEPPSKKPGDSRPYEASSTSESEVRLPLSV
jgi:hypothetical protein